MLTTPGSSACSLRARRRQGVGGGGRGFAWKEQMTSGSEPSRAPRGLLTHAAHVVMPTITCVCLFRRCDAPVQAMCESTSTTPPSTGRTGTSACKCVRAGREVRMVVVIGLVERFSGGTAGLNLTKHQNPRPGGASWDVLRVAWASPGPSRSTPAGAHTHTANTHIHTRDVCQPPPDGPDQQLAPSFPTPDHQPHTHRKRWLPRSRPEIAARR